eukprot:2661166-Prymnesium_polylepis.1
MICTHTPGTHGSVAGGVQRDDSSWSSADAAAYPPEFNLWVATAFTQLITGEPPETRPAAASPDPSPAAAPTAPAPQR